jgi:hypothetical protein
VVWFRIGVFKKIGTSEGKQRHRESNQAISRRQEEIKLEFYNNDCGGEPFKRGDNKKAIMASLSRRHRPQMKTFRSRSDTITLCRSLGWRLVEKVNEGREGRGG